MGAKSARAKAPKAIPTGSVRHGFWCLLGIGVSLLWTTIGCGIAAIQGGIHEFILEWVHLQGFFLIALGTWLVLIMRSKALFGRISALAVDGNVHLGHLNDRRIRAGIVLSVGILGTASLIPLGFPANGALRVFMWTTCALVCFMAGAATLHTLQIISAVAGLQRGEIRIFRYAPARTPELRAVVSYFGTFTLLVTIGYAFALMGTLDQHWKGSAGYIEAVRIFWPIIYVPTCFIALIYPHAAVHKLIRREKEKLLLSCQEDMDGLLSRFRDLKTEDIDRTNTLAQLFDRIAATPNYVIDFGTAVKAALPIAINVISFFAKAAFHHSQS